MGNTVGNIIARIGADSSQLSEECKKASNTILTFKDESLAALKSFGLPHISSTNLVEAIQSGQRVVVNFSQEAGESLAQFQQRVRTVFEEAGIDITEYERVLENANQVHAEFAKGAVKNFQAVANAAEEVNNKAEEIRESLGQSFTGITANIGAFKDSVVKAFQTLGDDSATAGEKFGAVSNAVVDGFGLMTGAVEVFLAVELIKKIGEWIDELKDLAAETQDVEQRFAASLGPMEDKANEFAESLSKSYGILDTTIKDQMSKEYMNTRMLGFDPNQAEEMSEHLTQLSYDLGKLRGEDPSQVFQSLQTGMEGQTRGLQSLGIRITTTDLKNRALSEGLIKQGQTMTDAQTSLMAYQEIMEKTQGIMGYYKTTADDISTQQTKLNAGWQAMKEKLAEDLTPAFTGLLRVLNFVASGFEDFVGLMGTAIQYISLFAEDAYSAVHDILSLNFGQINADWTNNYNSIFNSTEAAKQYGDALNDAMNATNGQDQAQKNLNKSVNANTMSFDQLHNITNAGTGAALAQADAVNNLANALGNLKNNTDLSNVTNNSSKGVVIPVSFKVPPFPPIAPPPAVNVQLGLINNLEPALSQAENAVKTFNPATVLIPLGIKNNLEPSYSQAESKLRGFSPAYVNVPISVIGQAAFVSALDYLENQLNVWRLQTSTLFTQVQNIISSWEVNAATTFAKAQTVISTWTTQTDNRITQWASALSSKFSGAYNDVISVTNQWARLVGDGVSSMVATAGTAISTFANNLHNDMNNAFNATEQMAVSWANALGQTITAAVNQAVGEMSQLSAMAGQAIPNLRMTAWQNVSGAYQAVASWAEDNKSWLVPLGAAAAGVGLTIATGGTDLVAGGMAAAGSALAGIGAAIPAMASGGIVTAPQLAMIGEAGPEAVIPLEKLGSLMGSSNSGSAGGNGQNSGAQPIQVTIQLDGRTLARTLYSYNVNENDRIGTMIGYNSSYNLPK
ncbi:hypothetical protein DEAC_c23590 [Desulfosporosinus acididurans]|uniref:Uncharacterized protein n=1 Tax=Desulfosporosinus acididurans TaxID=476652 RepID=A0A0J1FQG0_9FIRM|nr:hypothetical protein [Desulfosporosinus acididurans]KLU65729.1 hypothetical protein DEAC_c23590 [Desulfosporosinus acididurans]